MAVRQTLPGLYTVSLGPVNAFLIDEDELILIDTGYAGSEDRILNAVRAIGREERDLKHILVTHCHPDHAGSLASLKERTGAQAYMHPIDAAITRSGRVPMDFRPSPGLLSRLLARRFIGSAGGEAIYDAAAIEHEIVDGTEIPPAGGIRAYHAPGHCAGQLVFLWPQHGGVLFAADTAMNMVGLAPSLVYEDYEEGLRSLKRISELDFEAAVFGHGRTIPRGAAGRFRRKWGSS